MKAIHRVLMVLHLIWLPVIAAAEERKPAEPAGKAAPRMAAVRLEFNPGGGPWSGETAFQGASWHALGPGLGAGKALTMRAQAGIGDQFPVATAKGETLFEVRLANGMDDHLVARVLSSEGEQEFKLPRDKPVKVTVEGGKFSLLYPTTRVAAPLGTRPSTNKATIIVTQLP